MNYWALGLWMAVNTQLSVSRDTHRLMGLPRGRPHSYLSSPCILFYHCACHFRLYVKTWKGQSQVLNICCPMGHSCVAVCKEDMKEDMNIAAQWGTLVTRMCICKGNMHCVLAQSQFFSSVPCCPVQLVSYIQCMSSCLLQIPILRDSTATLAIYVCSSIARSQFLLFPHDE